MKLPGIRGLFISALRSLRGSRARSLIIVVSLALGIGGNSTIFALLNGLVLKPLPVVEPERLAVVGVGGDENRLLSYSIWEQLATLDGFFAGSAAWARERFVAAVAGPPTHVDGLFVSGGLFEVLGVSPLLGRLTSPDDDMPASEPVAVISHGFWQRALAGRADAVGRSITVGRSPFTIIGATPPSFHGLDVGSTFDVALPFAAEPRVRRSPSFLPSGPRPG